MATASGGFVFRGERRTLDIKPSASTDIGPGSYDIANSTYPDCNPAPAPFLSTKDRTFLESHTTSATTPGPGAYRAAEALDAAQHRHAESINYSAPFASLTARLHSDKSQLGKPGPGTYTKPNDWIKHQHRYTAPTSAQRVSYLRVPSAPSIPFRHQCFGYEEGQGGNLVMQTSPDPIYSGVGRDSVGPGAYDLVRGSTEKAKAVNWGNSRTKRGLQVSSSTPGPGQYDPHKADHGTSSGLVVSVGGVDVQFGGASGTSQFASKTPGPAHRTIQEWQKTPGPGQYQLVNHMGAATLPAKLQFFGSSSKRGSDIDPMKSLSAPTFLHSPGPAAYDPPTTGVKVQQQAMTDAKPFNSTGNRFGKDDNGVPGPGQYRPDTVVGMAKSVQDKAAISKGGVFGTTAERFCAATYKQGGQQPGPGEYEAAAAPSKPVHKGGAGALASKTKRFQPATAGPTCPDTADVDAPVRGRVWGDPNNLGPGAYTLPDQWSKAQGRCTLASNTPGFGSHARRMDPTKIFGSAAANPGPGRYNTTKDLDAAFRPMNIPAKENVFGSQMARFKGPGSYTPGPGHYSVATDLSRKSFNITFPTNAQ